MKATTKRIWLALPLVIAVTAAVALLCQKAPPPQIITLPDGEQYRLAGVSWGTRNVQPTLAAQLVDRLPTALASYVERTLGDRLGLVWMTPRPRPARTPIVKTEPCLHVWLRSVRTNTAVPPMFLRAGLADQDGVVAGAVSTSSINGMGKTRWLCATFPVVPRRSATLQCCLFLATEFNAGPYREIGRVRFPNPRFGRFPQWQPEPLPVVKQAGDVEARLVSFMTGTSLSGSRQSSNGKYATRYRAAMQGEEPESVFDLELSPLAGTNEVWTMERAELSDATGNHLRSGPLLENGGDRNSLRGTLWPAEAAWRLKVELKRKSGYAAEELVTFKNVPVPKVGAHNSSPLTNIVGGIQVVLRDFVRRPDITVNSFGMYDWATQIRVELPEQPTGVAVDFVRMTTNTGENAEQYGLGWEESARLVYVKSIPTNVETMDFTWAVQKTRTVEFMVEPPKQ